MSDKKKVLVIGSNSFSGSDFIDLLLCENEYQVTGISRSAEKSALFLPYKKRANSNFNFYQLDLNKDMQKIIELLESLKPDYVINFAAQSEVAPSWDKPEHWFQTNTVALAKLINALKDQKSLKRYVHISSPEVYGSCVGTIKENAPMNPSTPYAASKAAADFLIATYVKNYNFPAVTIRSTNVYGGHQQLFKIIPRTAIYLKLKKTINLHGGGVAVKSYIHIRDISRGELLAMQHGTPGELYHLSPDGGISIKDVVAKMCELSNNDFSTSVASVKERLGQDAAYVIDSSKARKAFSWKPQIDINKGLGGVIDWVDNYFDEIVQQNLEYIHKP